MHRVITNVTYQSAVPVFKHSVMNDLPCSQSMITPSRPVKAMIWACRTDGIAIKVIKGFSSLLSLFNSLRRGFCTVVVWAVGVEVGWIVMVKVPVLILGDY